MTYRDSRVTVRDDSHIGVLEETGAITAKHVRAHTYCHELQTSAIGRPIQHPSTIPTSTNHRTTMNTDAHEESEEHEETEEKRRMLDARFVEKFFTERELDVKYDKIGDSDKINAQRWYEAVEKTISELSTYKHDNVGQPLDDSESDAWFFRGQKDSSFAFTSTLYRRLLNASSDKLLIKIPSEHEEAMLQAELSLLDKARKIGIGRGLTALETLTLLQHHGSPTRLIDVTSDWKVALFFACESDDDRDGRLFPIKTNSGRWRNFPRDGDADGRRNFPIWQDYRTQFSDEKGWCNEWLSGTWPILLPFSDPRMISQRGFFLVGGVPRVSGNNNINTSKCIDCKEKRCKCAEHNTPGHTSKTQSTPIEFPQNAQELRNVTSLTIRFGADVKDFNKVANAKCNAWSAFGCSIRIPKEYKRTLRDILRQADVHKDSIYPPLRETVRLFEHVVDESLNLPSVSTRRRRKKNTTSNKRRVSNSRN